MATETLQVSDAPFGDVWNLVGAVSTVAAVQSPDDNDTSYIWNDGTEDVQQFNFADTSAVHVGDTITSVEIHVRQKTSVILGDSIKAICILSGNFTDGADNGGSGSYANYVDTFTTKPGGGAWTKADVDAMFVSLSYTGSNTDGTANARVTTVYAVVNYTPAGIGQPKNGLFFAGD